MIILAEIIPKVVLEWKSIWKEEKITSYASSGIYEGFAEAFMIYKKDPQWLKRDNPKSYNFMEEYLSG